MLEIRCSADQDEIEAAGTAEELKIVSQRIAELARGDTDQITFEANASFNPSPYGAVVKRMIVMKCQAPAKVSLMGTEEMQVKGSAESLIAFASFFDFESDAQAGHHTHFEYLDYEGNKWVSPGSIPLVIIVRAHN